jgi:uncharacterized NAD(P)/FAD-binding protein YdhS
MKSSRPERTVIIGGGAAGTLVALHLLRDEATSEVTIVERTARLGAGVAYSTSEPGHLLNVRCGGMSAYRDEPAHFTQWAARNGHAVGADDFVPRREYARYLREQLATSAARSPTSRLTVCCSRATRVDPAPRPGVLLADGTRLAADRVVLATGNQPPAGPAVLAAAGARLVRDPWDPGWLERLDPTATVLLLGTGLTAVDAIVSLIERRHRGPIIAASRHGLLPTEHRVLAAPIDPPCLRPGDPASATARGLLRSVRRAAADADDWRTVIDGLRPVTVALWRDLPEVERSRFLRHLSRRWEVARHRMAPHPARQLRQAVARGQLRLDAGRVRDVVRTAEGTRVTLTHAGTTASIEAAVVVDCTGPTADPASGTDPLLHDLLVGGLARRDVNGLGIQIGAGGAVVDAAGRSSTWLYAVGVLRRGSEWETTAIPELRTQAVALARLFSAGSRRAAA